MKRRTIFTVMIASLELGTGVYPAAGYPVTFQFAGEITYVRDDDGLLGGAVTGGSPFSGLYTFESTTPDSDPNEPRRGLYADTISFVSGQIAGIPFLGPLAGTNVVDVRDFPNTSFDDYLVFAEVELLSTALDFKLRLGDRSGTAFQSNSLPLVAPDLALFDSARFQVFDGSERIPFFVEGHITWLVPEPGTAVLLAFATLIILRRKSPNPEKGTFYFLLPSLARPGVLAVRSPGSGRKERALEALLAPRTTAKEAEKVERPLCSFVRDIRAGHGAAS